MVVVEIDLIIIDDSSIILEHIVSYYWDIFSQPTDGTHIDQLSIVEVIPSVMEDIDNNMFISLLMVDVVNDATFSMD